MRTVPEVVNRVVGWVDILGFKNLVNRAFNGDGVLLKSLYQALEETVSLADLTNQGPLGLPQLSPHLRVTAFSDSVVISDSFDDGFGFQRVVSTANFLAAKLLCAQIVVRGAFATGPGVHTDRILFGPGITAAYELETKAAVYPRLIFADDLVPAAQNLSFCRAKQDCDGLWYLDPFWQFNEVHQPAADVLPALRLSADVPTLNDMANVRSFIEESIKQQERDSSVLIKYRWLATKFNEAIKEYGAGEVTPIEVGVMTGFQDDQN